MNQQSSIKTQITFVPLKLTINLDVQADVYLEFTCGSHRVITQKSSIFKNKQCIFDVQQQMQIITSMHLKNNKFIEKKGKILVIFSHKNKTKKGGKLKIDISEYMNQKLQIAKDQKYLIECPDQLAQLSYEIQFKQVILNNNKKIDNIIFQDKQQLQINQIKLNKQIEYILPTSCQNCNKYEEQIKQLQEQLQTSQRSTISQRDSLNITKMQMLQNEIKCQYETERTLKEIITQLEIELFKQKQIIAQIMQECLQLGDSQIIEIIENVIQNN